MRNSTAPLPLIDAFKAIAAQIILFHHLSAYGPLAAATGRLFPSLNQWLFDDGRMVVQVFLVIGGFLAARALFPRASHETPALLPILGRRYLRLALPYLAALLLAIGASYLASFWLTDPFIPGPPTAGQLLAHVALLQNILGYDALSAGIWYIAIDFQLFGLLLLIHHFSKLGRIDQSTRSTQIALALTLGLTSLSLFWFNRDPAWDVWALYFFGAYGLGIAACWASDKGHSALWLVLLAGLGVAALAVDFRLRILLALCVALLIAFEQRLDLFRGHNGFAPLRFLSRISYAVFLVHFPILLLVNAGFARWADGSAASVFLALGLMWTASIALAMLFHRLIENPAVNQAIERTVARWIGRIRQAG